MSTRSGRRTLRLVLSTVFALALTLAITIVVTPRIGATSGSQITVNTPADYDLSGNPATDCTVAKCSFRAALEANDCAGGGDTVNVPAGDYVVDPKKGGPIIARSVTVVGASARTTHLDGNNLTNVLIVDQTAIGTCGSVGTTTGTLSQPSPIAVSISHVDIENGFTALCPAVASRPAASLCGANAAGLFVANGGDLQLTHVAIRNNSGGRTGGLHLNNQSTQLREVTLSGNQGGSTGGILANGHDLSLVNTTLQGNRGLTAGAISVREGSATVEWSTISGNTSTGTPGSSAGGIFNNSRDVIVGASILSNNGVNCGTTDTDIASAGNNIEDASDCAGFAAASDQHKTDPKLKPLGNNGGEVDTFALPADSPAVDKVAGASCNANQGLKPPSTVALTIDARDQARPFGAGCDVGAYEFAVAPATPTPSSAATPSGTQGTGISVPNTGGGQGPASAPAAPTPPLALLLVVAVAFYAGAMGLTTWAGSRSS